MNTPRQLIATLGALLLLLGSCLPHESQEEELFFRTWEEILASDTLRIGTTTSPLSFFLYRGEPLGTEYQKVSDFARAHDLHLSISLSYSTDSLHTWLKEGRIDLIISPQPMTRMSLDSLRFCGLVDTTSLVLVQRRGDAPIRSLAELRGKELHIPPGSAVELRAQQIAREIGADGLRITPIDTLGIEDLIERVATSDSIRYTLADERLAHAFAQYHPTLDIATRVSVPIRYAWTTQLPNIDLAAQVDSFFTTGSAEQRYRTLAEHSDQWRRYFGPAPLPTRLRGSIISPYDGLFRSAAKELGWHWSTLAAIAYHESTFRTDVIAWSGARGLMGIMPATGRSYGVTPEQLLQPEYSIKVAVRLLDDLQKRFDHITDTAERCCFVLASYNAGIGHVQDAQRLAEKYGKDPLKWEGSVRDFLKLKSTPAYYNDPVVKYGYVRGTETINYVDNIRNMSATYRAHAHK